MSLRESIYINRQPNNNSQYIIDYLVIILMSLGSVIAFLYCIPDNNLFDIIPVNFKYTLPVFTIIFASILEYIYRLKKIGNSKFYIILLVLIILILLILNPVSLYKGAIGTYNRIIEIYNIKYEDAIKSIDIECSVLEIQKFWILMTFLGCVIYGNIIKAKSVIFLGIYSIFILVLASCIGNNIMIATVIMGIGWLIKKIKHTIGYFSYSYFVWIGIFALFMIIPVVFIPEESSKTIEKIYTNIDQYIENVRYGEDSLPKGDLHKAYNMLDNDELRLTIKSTNLKTMYLKGFVGNRYKDGKWQEFPKATFRGKNNGIFEWLSDNDFDTSMQYKDYVALSDKNEEYYNTEVKVSNIGANRKYIYTPFSLKNIDIEHYKYNRDNQILSSNFYGCFNYSFTEESQDLPSELLQTQSWVLDADNSKQQNYLDIEKVYRAFVDQNYLDIPEEYKDVINNMFWKDNNQDINIYQATEHIREVLSNTIELKEVIEPTPEDKDALMWCIENSKTGNSPFFASLSTLAYRAKGIPARYVEGYFIDSQEEKDIEDTINITSKDGHAWVEVYFDGMGWLPVDNTPGYYYDAYILQQILKNNSNNAKSNNEISELSSNRGVSKGNLDTTSSTKITIGTILGFVTLIIIIITILIILLELGRIILLKYNRHKYKKMDNKQRVIYLYNKIAKMLRILGIDAVLGKNSSDTDKAIVDMLEGFKIGEYQRIYSFVEQSVYGNVVIMPHEKRSIYIFLDKVYNQGKEKNLKIKLLFRYLIL